MGPKEREIKRRLRVLEHAYKIGNVRMTLTYLVLDRARSIVWLVTGADKKPMLKRLLAGDAGIPAGRVNQHQAVLVTDKAAE
jgi:6-phosphogluconolactonase